MTVSKERLGAAARVGLVVLGLSILLGEERSDHQYRSSSSSLSQQGVTFSRVGSGY